MFSRDERVTRERDDVRASRRTSRAGIAGVISVMENTVLVLSADKCQMLFMSVFYISLC